MARCDLLQARLVPAEKGLPEPATAVRRVDEADVAIDARPVGLLVPPDTAVRDRDSVDLCDDEVASRVAALEVVVRGRERLGGLDAVVALASRARGDDPGELRVVGSPAERAEVDAIQLWKRRYRKC
jgi:hypothetical protein